MSQLAYMATLMLSSSMWQCLSLPTWPPSMCSYPYEPALVQPCIGCHVGTWYCSKHVSMARSWCMQSSACVCMQQLWAGHISQYRCACHVFTDNTPGMMRRYIQHDLKGPLWIQATKMLLVLLAFVCACCGFTVGNTSLIRWCIQHAK